MVREETAHDDGRVDDLLQRAFRGQDERDAVELLRRARVDGSWGLLAVRSERHPGADMADVGEGEVLGYLRLTPAQVDDETVLVMAPLAVAPGSRHQGVGTYLVQFAVEMVADRGYAAVVTPYDEGFLDRFGFEPADGSAVSTEATGRLRVAPLAAHHLAGSVRVPDALVPLMRTA
jgi:predicted N-acetyltransferase YhbS